MWSNRPIGRARICTTSAGLTDRGYATEPILPLSLNEAYCNCLRCGSIISSRENRHLSKCDSCGYVQHFNPITAVGVILFNEQSQVILIRRNREPGKGKLGLPGGFVDLGETAEVAATREVQEEIGIDVQDFQFIATFPNCYTYQNVVVPVLDIFFSAKVESNPSFEIAADEVSEVGWFGLTDATFAQMAFQSNSQALQTFRDQHRTTSV